MTTPLIFRHTRYSGAEAYLFVSFVALNTALPQLINTVYGK